MLLTRLASRNLAAGAPAALQRRLLSSSIKMGKNRNKDSLSNPKHSPNDAPLVRQPNEQTQPQVYTEQPPQQPPQPTFGQSLVIYALLGVGITAGMAMVRMVFAEGKEQDGETTE